MLFYIANPDRIASAPEVDQQDGIYARELVRRARIELAGAVWDAMAKPTVIGVARSLDIDRSTARRLLLAARRKRPTRKAVA